jgi:two-component system sensor histidine kinase KdpD
LRYTCGGGVERIVSQARRQWNRAPWLRVIGAIGAGGALALVTLVLRAAGANPATAGLLFLIAVLFLATWGGLVMGVGAAFAATACFNFFFLPPTGTFHIEAASNWAALAAFVIAAVLSSRLVVAARRQAETATARAAEVQALYELGVDLFAAETGAEALAKTAVRAVRGTGGAAGGLALLDDAAALHVADWFGSSPDDVVRQRMESLRVHGQTLEFPGERGTDFYLPLLAGGEPAGVLVARETRATRSALESAARLLALALEHDRLLGDRAHMEALHQSEELKTALVRAVSHDLSTPLTAMGLQLDGLRRALAGQPELTSRLDNLTGQLTRLQRRIGNLLSLARLESGQAVPRPGLLPVPDLVRAARESLALPRATRPLQVEITEDCPELNVDPSLALEILINLIENADRASDPGQPIDLTARRHPSDPRLVRLGVLDRGPGLPGIQGGRGEIDAGDVLPRGLGLEIAQSFALASGGAVRLSGRPGGGTCAWVDLPAHSEGGT